MLRNTLKRLFSKVNIADIKKLRLITAAPMSDCKQALIDSNNNVTEAKAILIKKNLAKANKKEGREQKEGLWGFIANEARTKAVMLNLTCETDFVAKSKDFINFCENSLEILLENPSNLNSKEESEELKTWLDTVCFSEDSSLLEAKKFLIANTEENIEFSRIKTINIEENPDSVIGFYLHRTITNTVGAGGSYAIINTAGNRDQLAVDLADNLAVHAFSMKPKHIYESQIPEETYEEEYSKIKEEMKGAIKGKPEHIVKIILRGKFLKSLEKFEVMELQNLGFMDSEETVGEYLTEFQKKNGYEVKVEEFGELQ